MTESTAEDAGADQEEDSDPLNDDGFPVIYVETPDQTPIGSPMVFEFTRTVERDGVERDEKVGIVHFPLRGPKDVIDRALNGPHWINTQLAWKGMTLDQRMTLAEQGHVAPDQVVSNDMTKVLTVDCLGWISGWQTLINTGAVWHAEGDVGAMATMMIDRGYCCYGHVKLPGFYGPVAGRYDLPPGQPGHLTWVEAMMGNEYANWLRALK